MRKQRIVTGSSLASDDIAAVTALINMATAVDGVRPLSEHALLLLRDGGDSSGHHLLVLTGERELAGYGHLDTVDPDQGPVAELVIHPAHRNAGLGRALVDALLDIADRRLRAWAHGELPGARALAAAMGFERLRALWQMRRPLSLPLAEPVLPAGVRLRTFDPEHDAAAWIELNREAFVEHPEQGRWTLADLRRRVREPWFDPAGFFLAEQGGRLVGFHWTKVHPTGSGTDDREPIGEVYVVGVAPSARGTGLGRALTLAGLRHLRARELAQVMLYVDESNPGAIALYTSLGFTHHSTDAMYGGV